MSLAALYRAKRTLLIRGLSRRYGAEAEDAVQEAFLRALGTDVGPGWVWVTARNVARDTRRRLVRSDRKHRTAPRVMSTRPPVVDVLTVHELLGRLPQRWREVIELYELQGYGCEEVAARLGVPVSTVRTRLHYARKAIRGEAA